MMKSIGEKIKEYRQKEQMTQEQLASCLNVTFQTVSKWETGVSNPDLSLIVPITKIFHISADELLGVNDAEHDERYIELKQAYDRTAYWQTFKKEDMAECQRICELAVSEYPEDMEWLFNLADIVACRSYEYEDKEQFIAEQEKAIRLYDTVIRNCRDDITKGSAILGIASLLGNRGRKDEARRYAEMLPERTMVSREEVLKSILDGDEQVLFKQKQIKSQIECALWSLSCMSGEGESSAVYGDLIRDIVRLLIPDGNYLSFNHILYYAVMKKINHALKFAPDAPSRQIYDMLTEMQSYANAYDEMVYANPGIYKYTEPWFARIEEDSCEWVGSEGETMTREFEQYLEEARFDPMRDEEAFQQLQRSARKEISETE